MLTRAPNGAPAYSRPPTTHCGGKPPSARGDINASDVFNPATEWDGFANGHVRRPSAHTPPTCADERTRCSPLAARRCRCSREPSATRNVAASDADGIVTSIVLTSVTPEPAGGSITLSGLIPAPVIGGSASATVNVSAGIPTGIVQRFDHGLEQRRHGANRYMHAEREHHWTEEIWEIQGSGAASPFVGQVVRTENNIVTALDLRRRQRERILHSNAGRRGPMRRIKRRTACSCSPAAAAGRDRGRSGRCHRHGQSSSSTWTELTGASRQRSIRPAIALPAAVLLTQVAPGVFVPSHDQPWPANELERFENMRVRVENGRASAADGSLRRHADRRRQHAARSASRASSSPAMAGTPGGVGRQSRRSSKSTPDAAGLPDMLHRRSVR